MFEAIKKRDGRQAEFDASKITKAISLAGKATGEFDEREARRLMLRVLTLAHEVCGPVPEVEDIQDIVERVLLDSPFHKTAKAYILYREQHSQLRNLATKANVDLVEQYIRKLDWKIRENSNMCYSLQGLNNYISSDVTSEYWLNQIYPPEVRDAHKNGDIHIHDLNQLSVYTYFGKEVVVAKYRGELLTLSFEQLYEMADAEETLLNEKDQAWAKHPSDLWVMDKEGWTRVTRLVRKGKERPMRFVKNRGGRSVIVTEDHPMVTARGAMPSKDVQIKADTLFTVDMVSRLSQESLFSVDRIDLVHELRSRGFNGRDGDTPYFNGFPVSECQDDSDGVVHTLSFCGPRYIRLTEAFGFFVGLTLAEGYLTYDNKSYFITMSSRRSEYLERANAGLHQHGWSGVITHRNHDDIYELRIRNRFLRFLFDKVFQIMPGSRNKTLPVGFLSYSQEFIRGMVAGVLDGDGAANGKTGVQLRMASRTLLEQMAIVLPFLGLFPRDRNCEGVGTVREYAGRTITQNFPIYGLGFRKIGGVFLPSEKYKALEPSVRAWQDETVDAWHKVLNNAETNIPDEYIYDITTETHTLVVNGLWNHNCVGWDFQDLLLQGFRGVPGKIESAPPKHFRTALGQLVNFIYTLQGECYSDDTEVLTDNGWKLFKDMDKENDKVHTLNPATKEIEIQRPVNYFEFENNGKGMIHFKNDETDLLVTPNHNMLVSQHGSDAMEYRFVKAGEWDPETDLIPTGGMGDNLRCIRMAGESIRETAYTGKVYCVEVPNHTLYVRRNGKATWCGNSAGAQAVSNFDTLLAPFVRYDQLSYPEVRQAMQEFVFNANIPTRVGFQCMSEDTEILTPEGWMGYADVKVGQIIKTFDTTTGKLEDLPVRRMFARPYNGEMYHLTNSDQDQLLSPGHRIVRKSHGANAYLLEEIEKVVESQSPVMIPMIGNGKPARDISDRDIQDTQIENLEKVNYSGVIWCPNTDNETVVARRNGKAFITGNTPFFNITMDLEVPSTLKDQPVIIGGKHQEGTYADFQPEMDMINQAFAEIMMEGDSAGRVFTFPIPTYNITPDFDWENPNLEKIWIMTGKFGTPYYSNFVNSDMSPEDVRSMCCRLRLSNKELIKRGGGLFGANPLTGSIGVATINLPRIGHLSEKEGAFFDRLKEMVRLAKESLGIKRKLLENFTEKDLYPYSKFYLREVKNRMGLYWKNHFSTIGIIGMNEACLNFLSKDIGTQEGAAFSLRVMDFIRDMLVEIQEETGDLFNLEATPAEGTSYRLAMLDRERYPDIVCANDSDDACHAEKEPYYTNSTQLPVNYTDDIFEMLSLQDELQTKYTGGTVLHIYLGEMVSDVETVKNLVRKITAHFKLPYFTLTPTFSICPSHGYLNGEQERCPVCDAETEVYSRVVGYLRPVNQWNKGKQAEFVRRRTFSVGNSEPEIPN